MFGEGAKSIRDAAAILAAATTLETCLECPFTRAVANKLLHCVLAGQPTGVSRPSGPKTAKRSSKESYRALRHGGVSKKSRKGRKVPEKSPKSVMLGTFRPFRDFFETLCRKAREDLFETFSRFSEGLETTVDGRQGRNCCT